LGSDAFDRLWGDEDLTRLFGDGPARASGTLQEVRATSLVGLFGPLDLDTPVSDETPIDLTVEPEPVLEFPDLPDLTGAVENGAGAAPQPAESSGDIDPAQILRDRPDVLAGFYAEFYGPNNDRNSPAWTDRVGGETPQDYARYWYETYGRAEGYVAGSGANAAPAEGAEAPLGRTTLDGVPIAKILADRPDVFQAFFTEFYGPNNDRHSDAWAERVGGVTVEDYAEYWYNAHGRVEGYTPSAPQAAPPGPESTPDPPLEQGPPSEPLRVEDPSLDPWNHPAIFPDWQPPYPGWRPPGSDATSGAPMEQVSDDVVTVGVRSLFDDAGI